MRAPLAPPRLSEPRNVDADAQAVEIRSETERPEAAGDTILTRREHDILAMIAKGFSYTETSQICGIATATVHSHLKSIYRKLEVHSKTEAVYEARRRSLIF